MALKLSPVDCGTPYSIVRVDELIPCIETYCCLLERYDENELKALPRMS